MKTRDEHGLKFKDETNLRQVRIAIALSALIPSAINLFFYSSLWLNLATVILAFVGPTHVIYRRWWARRIRKRADRGDFIIMEISAEREAARHLAVNFEPPHIHFILLDPLRDWCRQSCSGRHGVVPELIESSNPVWNKPRKFYFTNPDDAFAFKMRWL